MKKLFFVFALCASTFSVFAFAPATSRINFKARENFKNEFGNVSNVVWEDSKLGMQKASFIVDNQKVTSFYDADGELVATTVSVTKEQLPAKLRNAVDSQLGSETIDEIFSIEAVDGFSYYIGTNNGQKLYRAYANGTIREVSKQFFK